MLDLVEDVSEKVALLIGDLRSTREENQRLRIRLTMLEQDLKRQEQRSIEAYKRMIALGNRLAEQSQTSRSTELDI